MVKNYASIEIHSKELLKNKYPQKMLLLSIIKELKQLGLDCSKIHIGTGTFGTICNVGDSKVLIEVYIVVERTESFGRSIITCTNFFPWWKRFFSSQKKLHLGKDLQYV